MHDIQNKTDIKFLVDTFYDRARNDELIGVFFNQFASADYKRLLASQHSFWENILFHKGKYLGNPLEKHIELNKRMKLQQAHFQRWLQLFISTVESLYSGPNAEMVKKRASGIAAVMEKKIIKAE